MAVPETAVADAAAPADITSHLSRCCSCSCFPGEAIVCSDVFAVAAARNVKLPGLDTSPSLILPPPPPPPPPPTKSCSGLLRESPPSPLLPPPSPPLPPPTTPVALLMRRVSSLLGDDAAKVLGRRSNRFTPPEVTPTITSGRKVWKRERYYSFK